VTQSERRAIADAIASVPEDVSISGGARLLAHFSRNSEIKPFPAPFLCSGLLLTYHPRTSYTDFVVVEERDLEGLELPISELGYHHVASGGGVTVWRSTGSHPPSVMCPSIKVAWQGLFERIEMEARR
jgi:hypothetical protein